MAAGLYTKYNLSEEGLNATEALQKLYQPQIQQDLLLFAYSSRLESVVSSPVIGAENQIFGLVNESIYDSNGNRVPRTKFVTIGRPTSSSLLQNIYTFSDNNLVWFDKIPTGFDKRTQLETYGAPIKVLGNGALSAASVRGYGENYYVLNSSGVPVSLPVSLQVRVRGLQSGSESAVVTVRVGQDGSLDRSVGVSINNPGSGYILGEGLELITNCREDYRDDPVEDKCIRYTDPLRLYQRFFFNGKVSSKALLRNEIYTYRVRFADRDGFFLFDDRVSQYVNLGSFYDTIFTFQPSQNPALVIKRRDNISSQNLVQLYNLNGISNFISYNYGSYSGGESISSTIRNLSDKAEELRNVFKDFIQNNRPSRVETGEGNDLGIRYNILDGKSINSANRVVFRDPDGVLDQIEYEKSGTYSQLDETITVNIQSHGLSQGQKISLNFTSGLSVSREYTISSVPNADTFIVNAVESRETFGNVVAFRGFSFFRLRDLSQPDRTDIYGLRAPGIWLWTGEKYQRVFSSDDKPFMSQDGAKYLSPVIYGLDGNEVSTNKYSISASYLKPGQPYSVTDTSSIRGFNTEISTLIQNISSASNLYDGGFVFHRNIDSTTVRSFTSQSYSYSVKSWPIFSYEEEGNIKDANLLAVEYS